METETNRSCRRSTDSRSFTSSRCMSSRSGRNISPPVVEGSKELRKQSRNQRLFEQWSKLTTEQQAEIRAKSEYIHGHVENKDQIIHAPHAKSHTIKRMNEVITSVLGDQVYDNITRISTV